MSMAWRIWLFFRWELAMYLYCYQHPFMIHMEMKNDISYATSANLY